MTMTHATGTGDSHQASWPVRAGSRRHVAFWVAGATRGRLLVCGDAGFGLGHPVAFFGAPLRVFESIDR